MEVYKSLLTLTEEEGIYKKVSTIFHEGKWWLVATWLEQEHPNKRLPAGMIQMDGVNLRFQEIFDADFRFLVLDPLPSSVFRGEEVGGYTAILHPQSERVLERHKQDEMD